MNKEVFKSYWKKEIEKKIKNKYKYYSNLDGDLDNNAIIDIISEILFNINSKLDITEVGNIDKLIYNLYITIKNSKTLSVNILGEKTTLHNIEINNGIVEDYKSMLKPKNSKNVNEINVLDNYSFDLLDNSGEIIKTVYIQKLMEEAIKDKIQESISIFEKSLKNTMIQINNGEILDFYTNHNLLHIFGLPFPYMIYQMIDYTMKNNKTAFKTFDKDSIIKKEKISFSDKNNFNNTKKQINNDINNLLNLWNNEGNQNIIKNKIDDINNKIIDFYTKYNKFFSKKEYKEIMTWIDTTKCILTRLEKLKYSKIIEECYNYVESYEFYKIIKEKNFTIDKIENYINNYIYLPNDYQEIIKNILIEKQDDIIKLEKPAQDDDISNVISQSNDGFEDFKKEFKDSDEYKNNSPKNIKEYDKSFDEIKQIFKYILLLNYNNSNYISLSDYQKKIIHFIINDKYLQSNKYGKIIINKLIEDYELDSNIINNKPNNNYDKEINDKIEINYLNKYFAHDFYNTTRIKNGSILNIIKGPDFFKNIYDYYESHKEYFTINITHDNLKKYVDEAKNISSSITLDILNNEPNVKSFEDILKNLPRSNIFYLIMLEKIKKQQFDKKYKNINILINKLPPNTTCLDIQNYDIKKSIVTDAINEIYEESDFKISWENLKSSLINNISNGHDTIEKPDENSPDKGKYINYVIVFKKLLENNLIPKEITPVYTKIFWKLSHIKDIIKLKDANLSHYYDGNVSLIIDSTNIALNSPLRKSFSKKMSLIKISSIKSNNDKNHKNKSKIFTVDIIFPIAYDSMNKKNQDMIDNEIKRNFRKSA